LLLEGRDLEELLAQVRDEHGAAATIVSAEKVRTGGFGGLFAHPKYELTVEVDAGDQPPAASIEELAARADAEDLEASGPSFAAALAEAAGVPREAAPSPPASPAPAEPAAPSVRPFRPDANQPVARLGVRPLSTSVASSVADTVERWPTDPAQVPARDERWPTDPAQVPARDERWPTDPAQVPARDDLTAALGRNPEPAVEKLAAVYAEAAAPPAAPASPPPPDPAPPALPRRLESLGVPAELALRATAGDTYAAIVAAFATLPVAAPAPEGPGETLVVIGESAHAMDVARTVTDTLRLDHDDILFAGRHAARVGVQPGRRVTGTHDARTWAKRLRRSDAPNVVAVEAALDEAAWAASIVDIIRPAAVWCVVDASRKTSDVAHHLQGLRRVDAIAVRGTPASGDPASPLSLRVPVALLDGRPATAHAWAAMLCQRLTGVEG
jgi:hypothetical protein